MVKPHYASIPAVTTPQLQLAGHLTGKHRLRQVNSATACQRYSSLIRHRTDTIATMRTLLRTIRNTLTLPARLTPAARKERLSDRRGLPSFDPGAAAVIEACTAWLCAAQDH